MPYVTNNTNPAPPYRSAYMMIAFILQTVESCLKIGRLMMSKHASKPYNPSIANVYYLAGFIESWGRGRSMQQKSNWYCRTVTRCLLLMLANCSSPLLRFLKLNHLKSRHCPALSLSIRVVSQNLIIGSLFRERKQSKAGTQYHTERRLRPSSFCFDKECQPFGTIGVQIKSVPIIRYAIRRREFLSYFDTHPFWQGS